MAKIDKRLNDLENKIQPKDKPKIVVDWDENPEPAKPGEKIITWDDIEDKEDGQED